MKKVSKPEIKLGADTKRVRILGGVLVLAGVLYFFTRPDNPSSGSSSNTPVAAPVAAPGVRTPIRNAARTNMRIGSRTAGGRGPQVLDFHPTLKPKDPIDTARVDPTLDLNRLAKLRNVQVDGGSRSLFEFGAAPPSAIDIAKVAAIHPNPLASALMVGPTAPKKPGPPPPPPPPAPIPLKFYGYTNAQRAGPRRAFFLEGEDIYVAGEGEMIKNRYRIVRIGVNSAVVEDTTNKNQQTLPLVEEMVNS
jgi:hypothetical protein